MKKFIVFVIILITILNTGCNKTVPNPGSEGSPKSGTSNDDAWGLLLTTSHVTPKGLTIICIQDRGSPTGRLQTGSRYWLEIKEDEQWAVVETKLREEVWTLEAKFIPMNDTVKWEVDWESLYGELSAGEYRIGKDIDDFRSSGDYDTKNYYASFDIK